MPIASDRASVPVGYRLYLPREWAEDADRRSQAGVPAQVDFQTKPALAMQQIEHALAAGYPRGVVLADAAYGDETAWRARLAWWRVNMCWAHASGMCIRSSYCCSR